jgi:hypothetical protein
MLEHRGQSRSRELSNFPYNVDRAKSRGSSERLYQVSKSELNCDGVNTHVMACHPFLSMLDFCKLPLARWRDFQTSRSRCQRPHEGRLDLAGGPLQVEKQGKVVAGSDDKYAERDRGRIKQQERKRNRFASSPTKVARGGKSAQVNVKIIT